MLLKTIKNRKEKDKNNLLDSRPQDIEKFDQEDASLKDENKSSLDRFHNHDGKNSKFVNLSSIAGLFEIIDYAPTHVPKNVFEQVKLYVNGATYRIYFYDYKANAWRFA